MPAHGLPAQSVSLSPQAVQALDAAFAQAVQSDALVCAIAMACSRDGTLYQSAHGLRDRESGAAATLDDVLALASLTKAITAAAALQLVEQGVLDLDAPVGTYLDDLADPMVLEGFAADGRPRLRSAQRAITLRHLLTHTSGLGHDIWDEPLLRYQAATGMPGLASRKDAGLCMPLLSDPGEMWRYSIGLEWTGKLIEAVTGLRLGAYLKARLFGPLGMHDTGFGPAAHPAERLAKVYHRDDTGALQPVPFAILPGEYEAGGGGLYGTAPDYLRFLTMLLNHGKAGDLQVLSPRSVALMTENQIAPLELTPLRTAQPALSNNVSLFPGINKGWSLGGMLTEQAGPDGRSPGSLAWAGLANCYFWLDPQRGVAGVFLTQILPFADAPALQSFAGFERLFYTGLRSAALQA
ncbi:serine hydrolase domain-containing protein [Acidisoma silvae]|uniref:Beta-lactamase family protein n=1 Tax=Acidisoma silvae TaxID=2802396 RepID=A0A963YWR3_9PROT|nr:serine hydrolase domain-containing protein [Acidisoma silvae]MCB8878539.1 beta-lactamase family protein [Acidisoma silvae]